MRPFSMKVKFMKGSLDCANDDFSNPNIVFHRPCKCTCLCFKRYIFNKILFLIKSFKFNFRPEMYGFDQSKGINIGRVNEPFTCCDPSFQVFNADNQNKYYLVANCCQCGLCCSSCGEAKFDIFSTYETGNNYSVPVGSITKKHGGIVKEFLTSSDNFEVFFPPDATPEDKLMLIGTCLMIDYRYFEEDEDNTKEKLLV